MAASQESSRQYSVGGFKLKEGNKIEIVVKALRNLPQQKSSGCSHHKPLPEAGSSAFFQLMKSRFNSGVPGQGMNKKLTSLPLAPQMRGTLNIPVMDETGWSLLWGWWSVHDFWEHFPASFGSSTPGSFILSDSLFPVWETWTVKVVKFQCDFLNAWLVLWMRPFCYLE